MSRSGYFDRRGWETLLKVLIALIPISLLVVVFYSWKVGFALLFWSIYQYFTYEYVSGPPRNNTRAFLSWYQTQSRRHPTLLCLGDSLTCGRVSADITVSIPSKLASLLRLEQPADDQSIFKAPLWVVNAGQNGLTSHVILNERLSTSMGTFPDYIVLMIGTNDILGIHSNGIRSYLCQLHTLREEEITMAAFERNLIAIVDFIRESSPKVELGICTIPPIGEDLTSSSNVLIKEANRIIERAVSNAGERTTVIPVFSTLEAVLEKKRNRASFLPLDIKLFLGGFIGQLYIWLSSIGVTWNMISTLLGNELLVDDVHLNERSRDMIVDLIVDWLMKSNVAKVIALKSL